MKEQERYHKFRLYGGYACLGAIGFAVAAVFGWYYQIELLTKFHASLPNMQPNTALGIILAALAIGAKLSPSSPVKKLLVLSAGFVVTALGLLTLGEYFFQADFGIDTLLLGEYAGENVYPGRPAPQTAFNFLLIGLAIIFPQTQKASKWRILLVLAAAFNTILAVNGYFFSANEFFGFPVFEPAIGMAAPTGLSFLLLCAALTVCFAPQTGFDLFLSSTRSGWMARKVILAVILAPPLIGLVTRIGYNIGLYEYDGQVALFTVGILSFILYATWKTALQSEAEELKAQELFEELRKAREEIESLVEGASDGIFIADLEGRYRSVNQAGARMLGYQPEELIGKTILDLLRFEDRDKLEVSKQHLLKPGNIHVADWKLRTKGGDFLDVEVSAKILSDGRWLGIARDVSARKRAETALMESEQKFRFLDKLGGRLLEGFEPSEIIETFAKMVVAEVADGASIRLLDESGNFQLATLKHKYPEQEESIRVLGEKVTSSETVQAWIAEVLESGKPKVFDPEQKFPSEEKHGKFPFEYDLVRLGVTSYALFPLVSRGNILGMASFLMDVSKRKISERDMVFFSSICARLSLKLENATLYQKQVEAVAAREGMIMIVSHDLKNPIMSVKLALETFRRVGWENSQTREKLLKIIDNAVTDMETLVFELLDLGKIQSGIFSVSKEKTNFEEVASAALASFELRANLKNAQLVADIERDMPLVFCDGPRIGQVLSNLIGNAVKFTPVGGEVRLSAKREGENVFVQVSDTGPGIAVEHREHVFEPFWQGPAGKTGGSGLGLAIAQGIAKAHGANIQISERVGGGSVFSFSLPVYKQRDLYSSVIH